MLPKHWVRGTPVTHDDLCGVRMSLPIEAHPAHPTRDAIARRRCLAIVHWTPATGARFRGADTCTASRSWLRAHAPQSWPESAEAAEASSMACASPKSRSRTAI